MTHRLIPFAALLCSAVASQAAEFAEVVSATPVTVSVSVPRRVCRDEQQVVQPAPSGAGAVIGAIVGGVIGHQFGGSSAGRDHGTAAGAIVGGLVGNQVDRDNDANATRDVVVERVPVTRSVQRCSEIADTRDVVVGYDVRYEYNGHELRARLPYDPGPQMPVNVDVRPPAPPAPIADPRMPRYRGTY